MRLPTRLRELGRLSGEHEESWASRWALWRRGWWGAATTLNCTRVSHLVWPSRHVFDTRGQEI